MANPEQLAILEQGAKGWSRWSAEKTELDQTRERHTS